MLGLAAASTLSVEAASVPSATPSAEPSAAIVSDLAPADEYFGRMHLSVVRIHHQVFALKDELHHGRARPDAIQHETDQIDDAYLDWANRFPKDRWLPRMGWELATLYEELPGGDARVRAIALLDFLRDHFRSSSFADASQRELARGIGVRPWPRWARPEPVLERAQTVAAASTPAATDASSLLRTIKSVEMKIAAKRAGDASNETAQNLEEAFRSMSRDGSDVRYSGCAWELAVLYQYLPGEGARDGAIRMLALVLDRYPKTEYGSWSLRDLKRGVGVR